MFKKIKQMKDWTLQHSERMADLSTSREMMVMWNSKFAISDTHILVITDKQKAGKLKRIMKEVK